MTQQVMRLAEKINDQYLTCKICLVRREREERTNLLFANTRMAFPSFSPRNHLKIQNVSLVCTRFANNVSRITSLLKGNGMSRPAMSLCERGQRVTHSILFDGREARRALLTERRKCVRVLQTLIERERTSLGIRTCLASTVDKRERGFSSIVILTLNRDLRKNTLIRDDVSTQPAMSHWPNRV